MMIKKKISLFLLVTGCFFSVQAQDVLTLDQVVQATLQNNYNIQVASNNERREKIKFTRGNAGQLPDVSLGGSYSVNRSVSTAELAAVLPSGAEVVFDTTITTKATNINGAINVNYTLFDGFAMFHRYSLLGQNAAQASLNRRESTENIIINAISNFLEALRFQQQYLVLQESLEASKDRYDLVVRRKKAGSATNLDELNAQVDMVNDSSAVVEAQLNYKNALFELQYAMGKENYFDDLLLDNTFNVNHDLNAKDMTSSAMTKNVFIQQTNGNIEISKLQYKLAQAARYPTVNAAGSYAWSRNESPLSQNRSTRGPSLFGQLSISFDLFNGGRKNITQQAAKIDWDNTLLQKNDVRNMVSKDLYIAYENYATRLKVLDLLNNNLVNAEENFRNSQRSYAAGVITSLELRQAQVNLSNAKNRINNAKIDAKLAEVNVKRLAGVLLN